MRPNTVAVADPSESRDYYFIAGLPRSGSTLLSAILRQNPRFHASMTGPIASLFKSLIATVSSGSEISSLVTTEQRRRLARGLFDNYYADMGTEIEAVFDTSRSWTAHLGALVDLFPQARVICCVRNVAWVMDSLERQFRQHMFDNTSLFQSDAERSTVFSRTETLAKPNRLVGFALAALTEALYSEHAHRLMIVDYDKLVAAPGQVLTQIYSFIEQPAFQHDFDNVVFDAPSFDSQIGLSGLHRVYRKVEPRPRRTILPPDVFARFATMNVWDGLRQQSRTEKNPENKQDQSNLAAI